MELVDKTSSPEVQINQNFDSLKNASLYGVRTKAISGLNFAYYGGQFNGLTIADGTIALTSSSINYIEADADTGVVSVNTSAFTIGKTPIAKVTALTSTIDMSTFLDSRPFLSGGGGSGQFSDASFEVVDDGDATKTLKVQLSGSTTGTTSTIATASTVSRTYTLPDASVTLAGISDAIADGETVLAPTQNAVFDALALKQPLDADLTAIAALAGTSGLLKKTAADTWALDTSTYLTGNQSITLSGDITGTGTTSITTAIAAGVIVNADINASAGISLSKLESIGANKLIGNSGAGASTPSQIGLGTGLAFSGANLGLANTGVAANTYGSSTSVPVFAVGADGRITSVTNTAISFAGYATETYVNNTVASLVDTAPATLDTLNELAAALGDDPNFATTVTNSIATKEPAITAGTISQYWRGDKSWQTLDKAAVGLGNVDNTSDLSKPISTATQTALDLKVTGAASSTDNAIARFDGATGKIIQNSNFFIKDNGDMYAEFSNGSPIKNIGNVVVDPTPNGFEPTIIPYAFNDISNLIEKGGNVSDSIGNTTNTLSVLFDGKATTLSQNMTGIPTYTITITLPSSGYNYGMTIGVAFGFYGCSGIKIETLKGAVWTTQADVTDNTRNVFAIRSTDGNATAVTQVRFTFSNYNVTTSFRITQLFVLPYNSSLFQSTLLGTGGGNMYGDVKFLSGNLTVGNATNAARLHVKGSGNTSATDAFKVDNSSNTELFKVRDDGQVTVGTTILNNAVTNASVSTDNAIARFDGLTGKIIQNSAATISDNGNLNLQSDGQLIASIKSASDTSSSSPTLQFIRSRGTLDTPTAVVSGDKLAYILLNAYNGTAFEGSRRVLEVAASENWTVSNGGFGWGFYSRSNGTVGAPSLALEIANNQSVGIGAPTIAARLHVKGSGSTSATTAFKVDNSSNAEKFSVRDDGFIKHNMQALAATGLFQTDTIYGNWYADDLSKPTWRLSYNTTAVVDISMGSAYDAIVTNPYTGGLAGGMYIGAATTKATQQLYFRKNSGDSSFINGNVSVGDITPTAKLHVKGSGTTSATTAFDVDNSSNTNLVRVLDDGTVHIGTGTVNPVFNFTVEKASASIVQVKHTNTDGYAEMRMTSDTAVVYNRVYGSASVGTQAGVNRANGGAFMVSGADSLYFGSSSTVNVPIYFGTTTTSYMKISSGNVGIGTTSETARLHVKGSGATSATTALKVDDSTNGALLTIRDDGGYAFKGGTVGLAQTGYATFTNLVTLRTGDANTLTTAQLADILGTLIVDLKTKGIIAA